MKTRPCLRCTHIGPALSSRQYLQLDQYWLLPTMPSRSIAAVGPARLCSGGLGLRRRRATMLWCRETGNVISRLSDQLVAPAILQSPAIGPAQLSSGNVSVMPSGSQCSPGAANRQYPDRPDGENSAVLYGIARCWSARLCINGVRPSSPLRADRLLLVRRRLNSISRSSAMAQP
jgi:hypothetical protein